MITSAEQASGFASAEDSKGKFRISNEGGHFDDFKRIKRALACLFVIVPMTLVELIYKIERFRF